MFKVVAGDVLLPKGKCNYVINNVKQKRRSQIIKQNSTFVESDYPMNRQYTILTNRDRRRVFLHSLCKTEFKSPDGSSCPY